MKYLLITIICLASNCFACFGQQSSTNPIYLGPILIDKPSVEAMAKLCEQYKLTEVLSDDEYRTFKHDDGTLVKFNIISDSNGKKQPYVEINTTESRKNIEKILESTGFHKENSRYKKGYSSAHRFSTCQINGNKNKRVVFTKESGTLSQSSQK